MREIHEKSGVEFEARFEATTGVPTVPQTAHWRLRCLANDRTLQDWTEVTPEILTGDAGEIVGVRVSIDISGALNAILDRANRREVKELQVVAAKDLDREYSETLRYAVRAISGGR